MTIPKFWLENQRILFSKWNNSHAIQACIFHICSWWRFHGAKHSSWNSKIVLLSKISFSNVSVSLATSAFKPSNNPRKSLSNLLRFYASCLWLSVSLFGLASRFLKFVRSRAFRNSVNANATRRREVPPQTDSDAISHIIEFLVDSILSEFSIGLTT